MNRDLKTISALCMALVMGGCSHRKQPVPQLHPTAFGTAVVVVSGDLQKTTTGSGLKDPLVVQVNDEQGNAVTGALVTFQGVTGTTFTPAQVLTDSSGQASTKVTLSYEPGSYEVTAVTPKHTGPNASISVREIALDYQQNLGRELANVQCARCHDPESTAERVSNHDNLNPPPPGLDDGTTLNSMKDADLLAVISHGGPALGKSAEMPPYGHTLSKSDLQALVAYIRAVANPPYQPQGVSYAHQ